MVHSKAVRKPLVAIILNILMSMFFSRPIKIWHYNSYITRPKTKSANDNMLTRPSYTRLMLVGLPAWRKTEMQNLTFVFLHADICVS